MGIGTSIAIIGILIALFGFIDALATSPDMPEIQALRYILAALGFVIVGVGAVLRELQKNSGRPIGH